MAISVGLWQRFLGIVLFPLTSPPRLLRRFAPRKDSSGYAEIASGCGGCSSLPCLAKTKQQVVRPFKVAWGG